MFNSSSRSFLCQSTTTAIKKVATFSIIFSQSEREEMRKILNNISICEGHDDVNRRRFLLISNKIAASQTQSHALWIIIRDESSIPSARVRFCFFCENFVSCEPFKVDTDIKKTQKNNNFNIFCADWLCLWASARASLTLSFDFSLPDNDAATMYCAFCKF